MTGNTAAATAPSYGSFTMIDAVLHFNRAVELERLGQYDDAIQEYQDAARLNPNDADALVRLGLLLREMSRDEEANRSFAAALRCTARSGTIG